MIRRVSIERLAPTGEGVVRTAEGVGFVAGALPGEEVDAEVGEARRRFWKGRAVAIHVRSPDRISGGHAEGCAGCDWAHLDLARARAFKHSLFLETMERIGRLPKEPFGDLPFAPSPPGYRLRNRFHASGRGAAAVLGFFAPGTHRVEPADGCEALGPAMRALLPRIAEAVSRSGAGLEEFATAEALDGLERIGLARLAPGARRTEAMSLLTALSPLLDGLTVVDDSGAVLGRAGQDRLWLRVGDREFPAAAGGFFQGNRYLLATLSRDVADEAASVPAGRALDAYGGVGFFAGALSDAGHSVQSVESDRAAVELALEAKRRSGAEHWAVAHSAVLPFLAGSADVFDVAVVDPPRAGLGLKLASTLPERIGRRLIYVSCDPATLARDLASLTQSGLSITGARLYDLFALTHRVEAVVTLDRVASR